MIFRGEMTPRVFVAFVAGLVHCQCHLLFDMTHNKKDTIAILRPVLQIDAFERRMTGTIRVLIKYWHNI